MDPLTAAVIDKLEEQLDLVGLMDILDSTLNEADEAVKSKDLEKTMESYKDVFTVRDSISRTYLKKFGQEFQWKIKKSSF